MVPRSVLPRGKRHIKLRLLEGGSPGALRTCSVPGCSRAPEARSGDGLSPYFCRYHREFRSRHGCAWKRSYTGSELRPYVRAADAYVASTAVDRYLQLAITAVDGLLLSAGPERHPADFPRMPPDRKARASLARVREAGVPPERIVAVHAAVLAAIAEDPFQPDGEPHRYARVQVAKALRRRASGTHIVYGPGSRFDAYPRSSGLVLVELGRIIEEACDHFIHHHLAAVLALKIERWGPRPPPTGPAVSPQSRFGNEHVRDVPPDPAPNPAPSGQPQEAADKDVERYAREARELVRMYGPKGLAGKF